MPPSIQFPIEKEQDNKLPFLNVLVIHTEQGHLCIISLASLDSTSISTPIIYNIKEGIIQCRAKAISSNTDAYQEMINLHDLHHNYPESITSAPRNPDRRIEDDTQKLTTVCLPYVKGLAERIQKICSPYDIRTIFTNGSTLQRYLFCVKPPTEFNMSKNYVYSIPCSCGKVYKGLTCRPLKVRLEEYRKGVVWGKTEKSGMADHI